MDDFESICVEILSTIASAIEICQTESNELTTVWESEKEFCSSLETTLKGIIACSTVLTNQEFPFALEIDMLIQAVLRPLPSFHNTLAPYMPHLRRSCEFSTADEALAELQVVNMEKNVIEPVEELGRQLAEYLQRTNTLLLLYIIDGLLSSSDPLQMLSEEERLTYLQDMRQRAIVPALAQDLEQLTTLLLSTTDKFYMEELKKCLVSIKQNIHHHWETMMHGPLANATASSGYDVASSVFSIFEIFSRHISSDGGIGDNNDDDTKKNNFRVRKIALEQDLSDTSLTKFDQQPYPTDLSIVTAQSQSQNELLDGIQDEDDESVETDSEEEDSEQEEGDEDDEEDEDDDAMESQNENESEQEDGDSEDGDSSDETEDEEDGYGAYDSTSECDERAYREERFGYNTF